MLTSISTVKILKFPHLENQQRKKEQGKEEKQAKAKMLLGAGIGDEELCTVHLIIILN